MRLHLDWSVGLGSSLCRLLCDTRERLLWLHMWLMLVLVRHLLTERNSSHGETRWVTAKVPAEPLLF